MNSIIRFQLRSFLSSTRGVRGRPPRSPGKPVEWLQEATTYADTHNVIVDPFTRLPYPDEEIRSRMESSVRETLRARNKAKYAKRKISNVINFDHVPIEDQVVVLFPGQGAQTVGMASKSLQCDASRALFSEASEHLGYDLLKLCQEGPKSKLDQTIYCQPAVFVSSLAAWERLKVERPEWENRVTDVAGFSVGEYAALVRGGILTFQDALRIVAIRAKAMHECNQLIASGMLTVRVSAASRLEEAMAEAREVANEKGELPICEVANFLFCGVKVVGASETCMRFLEENAEKFSFQVVKRLAVSGAFHTRQQNDAVVAVKEALKEVKLGTARANVYSNESGHVYPTKGAQIRWQMVNQINHPVKWEQIMQLLYRKHKDFAFPKFVEVGPGRQLGAMLLQVSKKAHKHYENFSS